jgi:hypothetical protein
MIETDEEMDSHKVCNLSLDNYGINANIDFVAKKHILSHQHIFSSFSFLEVVDLSNKTKSENEIIIKIEALADFPLPRLIDRFLEENTHKIFK